MGYDVCFQAEEGIRDLGRSRGLGEVYKRQLEALLSGQGVAHQFWKEGEPLPARVTRPRRWEAPVSYTHLTLPTSDLV